MAPVYETRQIPKRKGIILSFHQNLAAENQGTRHYKTLDVSCSLDPRVEDMQMGDCFYDHHPGFDTRSLRPSRPPPLYAENTLDRANVHGSLSVAFHQKQSSSDLIAFTKWNNLLTHISPYNNQPSRCITGRR